MEFNKAVGDCSASSMPQADLTYPKINHIAAVTGDGRRAAVDDLSRNVRTSLVVDLILISTGRAFSRLDYRP